MFNVQRSMFNVQRSMSNVQRSKNPAYATLKLSEGSLL